MARIARTPGMQLQIRGGTLSNPKVLRLKKLNTQAAETSISPARAYRVVGAKSDQTESHPDARMGLLASTAGPPSASPADFECGPADVPALTTCEGREAALEAEKGSRAQGEGLQASLGANWCDDLKALTVEVSEEGNRLLEVFGRIAGKMAMENQEQRAVIEELRVHIIDMNRKLVEERTSSEPAVSEARKDAQVVDRLDGVVAVANNATSQDASEVKSTSIEAAPPTWGRRVMALLQAVLGEPTVVGESYRRQGNEAPIDELASIGQVRELESWGKTLGADWFDEVDRLSRRQPGFAALIRKSMVMPDVFGHGVEGQDFRRLTGCEAARLLEIIQYDPRNS